MRHIDCFNHFIPAGLRAKMLGTPGGTRDIGMRMQGIPCIFDVEKRLAMVAEFPDYSQVLSLSMPPIEAMAGPADSPEFAMVGNDGLAELVARHPKQFCGYVASLPMNNPDAAVREAERVFRNGANGLQIFTNVNGACLDESRFFPIFELAHRAGKPILLHPARGIDVPDFPTETKSKYEIWALLGWPYETQVTMARLIFSGLMTKLAGIRIVTHHLGAAIPFYDERIGGGWDQLGTRTSDEDLTPILKMLGKRPVDCFRDFYGDTALCGSKAGILCGLEFFGADHVLFATDCPFDPEKGPGYIRSTIKTMAELPISQADRDKICWRNAVAMFGLKA